MTNEQILDKLDALISSLAELINPTWTKDWTWEQFSDLHTALERLQQLEESLKQQEEEAA